MRIRAILPLVAAVAVSVPVLALDIDEASVDGRLSYFDPTQAKDTFDANFSGGKAITFGVGGMWVLRNGLYLEGAFDYYKKSGHKVYIGGGQSIDSGFSTDIKIIPITASAGYVFMRKSSWSPYVGGGIGYYKVDVSDGNADNAFGYHILGGVELLKGRAFGLAAELKFSTAPNALGNGGTSALFDEDNVGGITLTVKGMWRYRYRH